MHRIPLLLLIILTLTLSACALVGGQPAAAPSPTPFNLPPVTGITPTPDVCEMEGEITLGAVVSLTGAARSYGVSIRNGFDLAVAEINQSRPISPRTTLRLIYKDDRSDATHAVTAFEELIAEEVTGILGPTLSTAAFEADPLAQAAGIPVVATSNTAEGINEIGSYIFRAALPESAVVPNTLNAVREALDVQSVFIIYDQEDAFTLSGYETMRAAAQAQGLAIKGTMGFNPDQLYFNEIIDELEATQPDLIMVSALVGEAIDFMTQLRLTDKATPVLGGDGFNSSFLYVRGGEPTNGAISGAAWSPENNYPESAAFVEAYRLAYNSDPDQFAAQAYTGVWLYAHALRDACTTNRADVRNSLAALRLIATPLGRFSFTTERNPLHPPVVLVIENGERKLFNP